MGDSADWRAPRRLLLAMLSIAVSTIAMSACGSGDSQPGDIPVPSSVTRETDLDGVEIVISSAPEWPESGGWSVAPQPEVEIGVEAGEPEYMLSNVGGAVQLADGRIVVADGDALTLRVYDAEGRYLSSIGRSGGGPGEFEYLFGVLECVPDQIWAQVLPRALSRFTIDGEFIGLLRISLPEGGSEYAYACNAAGQHLVIGWGMPRIARGLYRTTTQATLLDAESAVVADLGQVHGSERWGHEAGSGPHDYGRQTVLALGDDRAYVGEADDFEIREFDLTGRLVRRIRWQGRELALEPTEIDRYKAWVTETQELDPDSRWAQELVKMEFPATMPAYTALRIDEADNLWVRRFARPGIRDEAWDVFGRDGTWRGRVDVPIGLEITEIGDEHIVGIFQDDLGTEFVRLHRIDKQGISSDAGTGATIRSVQRTFQRERFRGQVF